MFAFGVLFDHSARTQRQAGPYLDVLQIVLARSQRLIENIGFAVRGAVVQPHAGLNEAGRVFRGNRFTRHG